ncbi:ras-related protein Rab-36 isoform X2 [Moschus berezovskii]|uniref:ras-related protein Rab-36 isoform X2 n=1 Tax=Moschus berezovskii TaxID=68408 RepID=UPI002443FC25|nr:ras-related protein Rab-36 isoform X2 [Moschus berezovskii]
MRSSLTPLGPSVSRDRIITSFPKWYTPAACLQLREHFHGQVSAACQRGNTGTVGLRLSKAVVVGDLYVGKTSLIHRFCKNVFDHDYKATIGVDFEIERFEVAGTPFSLQIWDTAGQEKFKCIASAYYRGAQVIITAFDLTDVQTLEHSRQWLEDALRENEPGSCFLFLVGTKKDLLSGAACEQAEAEAVRLANEMQAEYWSVSAKTGDLPDPGTAPVTHVSALAGENVKAFFSRVAALAFEHSVLQDLERRSSALLQGWRDVHPTPRTAGGSPAQVAVSQACGRGLPPSTRRAGGVCATRRGVRSAHRAEPQGPPPPPPLRSGAGARGGPTAAQGPTLGGQSHLQSCLSSPATEAQDCRHGICSPGPRPRAQSGLPRPLPSLPGSASESPSSQGPRRVGLTDLSGSPGKARFLSRPRLFCEQGWASRSTVPLPRTWGSPLWLLRGHL